MPNPSPKRKSGNLLVAVFLLSVLAFSSAGVLYFKRLQTNFVQTRREQLSVIADLKVRQIVNWRRDVLSDTAIVFVAPFFARPVAEFLANPSAPGSRAEVESWLGLLQRHYQFDQAQLIDANRKVRFSAPAGNPTLDPHLDEKVAEALRTGQVVICDLHRSPSDSAVHMHLLVPVVAAAAGPPVPGRPLPRPGNQVVAVLEFRINPYTDLYPLIQSWPAPSRTGEILLVRREGDEVVYLNSLRHQTNAALALRLSLAQNPRLPAAMALLGKEGVFEGRDYRNVPVLAAVQPVPGSPWYIVAKMDQDEAFAPLWSRARVALLVVVVLSGATGLGVWLIWQQRESAFTRAELSLERQRQELTERMFFLTKQVDDIILLLGQNWEILEANDRAVETYGYTPDELLRRTWRDLLGSDSVAEFDRQRQQFETQESFRLETRQRRRDGSTFPVEVSFRQVTMYNQRFCQTVTRDITERKQKEEEIRRLNRLYAVLSQVNEALVRVRTREEIFQAVCRTAVEAGKFRLAWIGWHDRENHVMRLVAQAGEDRGYLEKIVISTGDGPEGQGPTGTAIREGKPCVQKDFLRAAILPLWREAMTTVGIQSGASFPIRLGGEVCWALTLYAGHPDFFQAEEVKLLEEVALNVSFALDHLEQEAQRRGAEEALQVSETRFRLALEAANEGLWEWNVQTGETYYSPRWYTMLGYEPNELPPGFATWVSLLHPDDQEPCTRRIQACVDQQVDAYEVEFRLRTKSGAWCWVLSRGRTIERDDRGRPTRMAGTHIDITERKRAEMQITRLNAELEQRVIERTAQLMTVNKELEAFSYSVSHDLRAPLRHIIGFSELLAHQAGPKLDVEGQRLLKIIMNATREMDTLVSDLLEFSRMSWEELCPARVDMAALVRQAIAGAQPDANGRKIVWNVAPLPAVYGDAGLLRQVWVNLVSNAVKYTRPRAEARIEIGCHPDNSRETIFYVRDNGVGFDAAYTNKLFRVFQRLHRVDEFEGNGIGLASIQRIVQRHGGRTWAEGAVGEGATFFFSLPKSPDNPGL